MLSHSARQKSKDSISILVMGIAVKSPICLIDDTGLVIVNVRRAYHFATALYGDTQQCNCHHTIKT